MIVEQAFDDAEFCTNEVMLYIAFSYFWLLAITAV